MKKLLFIIFPITIFSQVGINTTTPSATLDVMGNLKLNAQSTTSADSILVIQNREIKKIALSSIQNNGTCPNFHKQQSSGHYLLFSSPSSINNPTSNLTIQNKNFVSAGAWISNNTYFYSWSNTTGQSININNLSVNFSGLNCNYN